MALFVWVYLIKSRYFFSFQFVLGTSTAKSGTNLILIKMSTATQLTAVQV